MAGKSRSAKFYSSNPASKRRKLEYDKKYQASKKQKANRASRNAARKKLGLKVGDTRDASHKNNRPTDNRKSNLKAEARSKNRGRK